ncbi:MAG: SDR family oxidoreductase [Pseudohongiella sp.]|nr:SDR family oxidoreductase [Pseudohongiella sp.]
MRVLVTGSQGFIGKNLVVRLGELTGFEVLHFDRSDTVDAFPHLLAQADALVHLAGENRPGDIADFVSVNVGLTKAICAAIKSSERRIPFIFASSIQADNANAYGESKQSAEQVVKQLSMETNNPAVIYRLPNVFGKWCKPNYNSVVATFCHNIANDLPIQINDAAAQLRLVYVDDVVSGFIHMLNSMEDGVHQAAKVVPEYSITVGDLAEQIEAFRNSRSTLVSERVGAGLVRALYSTYMSYLKPAKFAYDLPRYSDERGVFVEMLKTTDSGQFSYFTVLPGSTRGDHYHHSKTEKFLVIKGSANFKFRHILSNEVFELDTTGETPRVVETVPGWTHNITNVGEDELIVMLWANEIFDSARADTIAAKI